MVAYSAKVIETISYSPKTWDTIRVGVFRSDGDDEVQIGEYHRNYPRLFNTFFPCTYGDKDYALYSPDYTVTRIMKLPSCQDIGGEEPHSAGFCPVDYYVPRFIDREFTTLEGEKFRYRVNEPKPESLGPRVRTFYRRDEKTGKQITIEKPDEPIGPVLYYPFGFIAGCIWGDDSTWKIQFLDLSEIVKGVLKRDARFGYIEMPNRMTALSEVVDMSNYHYDLTDEISYVRISIQRRFDLTSGKGIDDDPFS